MLVYRVAGIGTVWIIGFYPELIRMDEIYLVPFGTFDTIDSLAPYLLNILMTMPLGFLLPLIWKKFRSVKNVALAGFSLSLAVELSQLLNRRTTTTDDLIANTLGAVVGYFIFVLLFKIFRKDSEFKTKSKHRSPFLRYEAIIYLICSFMGVFLFYNGFFIDRINDSMKNSNASNGAIYDFHKEMP
jgi:glycopeptide antibiotics resistance protein